MSNAYAPAYVPTQLDFIATERTRVVATLKELFPEHRIVAPETPAAFVVDANGAAHDEFTVPGVTGALPPRLMTTSHLAHELTPKGLVVRVPHAYYWRRFPYCTRADACLVVGAFIACLGVGAATLLL